VPDIQAIIFSTRLTREDKFKITTQLQIESVLIMNRKLKMTVS